MGGNDWAATCACHGTRYNISLLDSTLRVGGSSPLLLQPKISKLGNFFRDHAVKAGSIVTGTCDPTIPSVTLAAKQAAGAGGGVVAAPAAQLGVAPLPPLPLQQQQQKRPLSAKWQRGHAQKPSLVAPERHTAPACAEAGPGPALHQLSLAGRVPGQLKEGRKAQRARELYRADAEAAAAAGRPTQVALNAMLYAASPQAPEMLEGARQLMLALQPRPLSEEEQQKLQLADELLPAVAALLGKSACQSVAHASIGASGAITLHSLPPAAYQDGRAHGCRFAAIKGQLFVPGMRKPQGAAAAAPGGGGGGGGSRRFVLSNTGGDCPAACVAPGHTGVFSTSRNAAMAACAKRARSGMAQAAVQQQCSCWTVEPRNWLLPLPPPGQPSQRCNPVLLCSDPVLRRELDRWAAAGNLPGVTSVQLPSGDLHELQTTAVVEVGE